MQHNLALTNALREALQRLGKEQLKIAGKDQMRDIDVYKAETDRFKALQEAFGTDPEAMKRTLDDLIRESAQTHLVPILEANRQTILDETDEANKNLDEGQEPAEPPIGGSEFDKAAAPIPGALRGHDGEWYLTDPTRQGKFMRIAPLAQERTPRNITQNM